MGSEPDRETRDTAAAPRGSHRGAGHGAHPHKGRWRHLLMSALFMASIVHLAHLHTLLEVPAHLAIGNLVAHWIDEPDGRPVSLAVLELDRQHYRDRYGGRSPLNRCQLKEDVEAVLKKFPKLQVLALDFDLSPAPAAPFLKAADRGTDGESGCDEALLNTLEGATKGMRVIAILPVDPDDRANSSKWRAAMQSREIYLAEPTITVELGAVRQYTDDAARCPSLGRAVNLAIHKPAELDERQAHCLTDSKENVESAEATELSIDFHRLLNDAWLPRGDADQGSRLEGFDKQLERISLGDGRKQFQGSRDVRQVLLGPGYDSTDEYLTPLGLLSGVRIHAAIALGSSRTVELLNFALDVLLGVVFGHWVHGLWNRYFKQRLGHARGHHPDLAYLWIVGLGLVWALLALLLLPALSIVAMRWLGLWISPVPMLIGMSIDAFALGSIVSARDLLSGPQTVAHRGFSWAAVPKHPLRSLGLALPHLAWWLVVGWVVIGLAKSLFSPG